MGLFKFMGGVATPFFQTEYWYKINDKAVSRDEYLKYQNKPGSDEKGKQTNDPDVYGRKCGGSPTNPKICKK
jgi:hypothetical protein|tara:strand:- start:225 stop:440 length:216 start_codon:yes stop_codon:yes gene_type:complete